MSGLKESIENLLELKDEVMRAYYDPLGEDGVFSYSAKEKEPGIKQDSRDKESSDPAFCSKSCY